MIRIGILCVNQRDGRYAQERMPVLEEPSSVRLISLSNPDAGRGLSLDFLISTDVAFSDPRHVRAMEILRPCLAASRA